MTTNKIFGNYVKYPFLLYMLLSTVVMAWPGPARAGSIEATVPPDVLADYTAFLDGRDPLAVTDYSGPYARRDVIEVVLFLQALSRGGFGEPPRLKAIPSYTRSLLAVRSGVVVSTATSVWKRDVFHSKDILPSPPMIRPGEFEAGLYTAPGNRKALDADSEDDVRRLTGVCSRQWMPDWEVMQGLRLRKLSAAPDWRVMVRMTAERRADFLLAPFQPTEDMRLEAFGSVLVPIPGLKVRFPDCRLFAVSRTHPQGERCHACLVRGLRALRREGIIEKAYTQCGFFNPRTRDWRALDWGRSDVGCGPDAGR